MPYFGGLGDSQPKLSPLDKLEASEEELLHEAGHIAIASVLAASFMVPLSLILSGDENSSLRDCQAAGFFGVYSIPPPQVSYEGIDTKKTLS